MLPKPERPHATTRRPRRRGLPHLSGSGARSSALVVTGRGVRRIGCQPLFSHKSGVVADQVNVSISGAPGNTRTAGSVMARRVLRKTVQRHDGRDDRRSRAPVPASARSGPPADCSRPSVHRPPPGAPRGLPAGFRRAGPAPAPAAGSGPHANCRKAVPNHFGIGRIVRSMRAEPHDLRAPAAPMSAEPISSPAYPAPPARCSSCPDAPSRRRQIEPHHAGTRQGRCRDRSRPTSS